MSSTTPPPPPQAAPTRPRKPWWKRKRVLIPAGALVAMTAIGSLLEDDTTDTTQAATTPTPTASAEETTAPAEETTTKDAQAAAEETTEEPTEEEAAQGWDAEAAKVELLDDVRTANGMRTLEESCTSDMIAEGTWFQCYVEDVEFTSPSTLRVIMATPGDVDDAQVGESARTWFVNMIDPAASDTYLELSRVYTTVNGLDSGRIGSW